MACSVLKLAQGAICLAALAGLVVHCILPSLHSYCASLSPPQVSAIAWMSMVMSAFLGFLALTVVVATFYVMRSWSLWLGRSRGRRGGGEPGAAPLQVGEGRELAGGGGGCTVGPCLSWCAASHVLHMQSLHAMHQGQHIAQDADVYRKDHTSA